LNSETLAVKTPNSLLACTVQGGRIVWAAKALVTENGGDPSDEGRL